ncbi:MarR family winged helix-turn-helix transcriptional regulator [Scrofimicrobium canadense]|uniref:MarR family winged helix-turn-helix transcriptional regulator n=1 Tax=Scrofimicrobium canadense TaxID=2652290 RepID=UPI00298EBCCE|nr:MarR family transcriptional regulator [Scrofimicrobium canadense]
MSPFRDDESRRIVDAWRTERPDLDPSPMLVFSRLSRLSRHLDRERRKAFAAHDLETWEFDVLAALRRSGEPYQATPGALMNDLLVSSGTMTNRIDRLEEAGLVQRKPSNRDRRVVLVQLTDAGAQRVDGALEALLKAEKRILSVLELSERTELASLLFPLVAQFENP